jgi:hypothetical protein
METHALGHRRLSRELNDLLTGLNGEDTTLGAIVDAIGERGFGLLLMVLALPAALPIPAPGYATPFGILMAGLGVQMILGRSHPKLPQAARRRSLSYKNFRRVVRGAGLPLKVAEFLIRPRLGRLARARSVHRVVGAIVVLMACFMMLPIPLTNTAPSFVIFLLAASLLEEDGLLLLAGALAAPIAAGIAILALYFAWTHGLEALEGGVRGLLERIF